MIFSPMPMASSLMANRTGVASSGGVAFGTNINSPLRFVLGGLFSAV